MTKYAENFSINLKNLRKEKGLTQKELADILGYSEKTVSKWECGACIPDIEVLFDLSKVFQTNVESLFMEKSLYFLGIDGGGTKTDLALSDISGNIVRTYKTDSCNPIDIGLDEAKRILKNAIFEICKDIPFSNVYCFAGIAGGTTADMQKGLKDFFAEFNFRDFLNDSDNKNIIASGIGDEDGMTVIMGTGVCVYTQINKIHSRIAGWGYLIDNGGSGYNLGRDALNAYFCAYDKTGPETLLSAEIEKIYPGGVQSVMGYIYDIGKKAVASFAPAVFRAFEKGDKLAEVILKRNLDEVVNLIKTAGESFENSRIPIVLAGGLTSQNIVIDYLKNALSEDKRFDIKVLDKSPVHGAVKLALNLKENEVENYA